MANASGLWIPVLPSLDQFGPALTKGVAKDAEKAGKTSGKTFGLALGAAAATFAGVAAAGTALFNVGKTFQDMTNTIRIGTGAAGEDLDSLVDIAKNVGTQVPADFESIGNAVADLNTMMGLTGDDLEMVSSQVLEAGRMLGEEVDISAVGQSFNAFGVEAEDVSGSLDFLFNVSQATGIGMNDLANQARQAAPAAEALGFSFEETAGLIGQLDNAGLDSGKMLQNMSRRLKDVAQDGEEPRDTFNRVASEIEEMVESGDRFGAQDLAGTAFGTRNAEQFIKALEDGTMNLEDLTGAAAHSGDTIMGLSEETMTFSEHWQIFKNRILEALAPVAERVFGGMGDMLENLSGWMTDTLIPAFEGFVGWLDRAKTWLIPLAGVLAGVAGSIIAVNTAISIWTSVTKAWNAITVAATAIQKGFNAVLKANPIGLVITAITLLVGALVWFFTQTELGQQLWQTFTDALVTAWDWVVEKVGGAATWLWESVLEPVIGWISDAWTWLMDGMAWAWENVLKPAWDAIATAATWMWENVLQPVFSWIGGLWGRVLDGISWYWENVLKPVWDAIAVVATWLWENVLKPVFGYIASQWQTTLDNMKWAWDNVLKPAWDALVDFAQWLWNDVLSPIFTWIGEKWSEMSDTMSRIWENYIEPIFDSFGSTVEWIQGTFERVVDAIKDQWEKLKGHVARPVKFVIDTVYNEGIRELFNKIAGTFGLDDWKLDPYEPAWLSQYATGGWTGPGSKYQPAGVVHADEYVLSKEATNKLRAQVGLSGLDYMNRTGQFPGYASGGLVQPVSGPVTSRFGPRWGSHHSGIDWAVPIGTAVRAALGGHVLRTGFGGVLPGRTGGGVYLGHPGDRQTYYGHLSRIMVNAGEEIAKGQIIALSGNTGNSTGPHLHFETHSGGSPLDPARYLAGATIPEGDGTSGGGLLETLVSPLRNFIDGIGDMVTNAMGGSDFVELLVGGATGIGHSVIDWAIEKITSFGDWLTGDSGGDVSGVKDQVKDVAARYGWDSGSQWQALDKLVQAESSWNVNAANPNSTARGLFQKMTSIHGPVGDTAAQQAEWGLNYIRNRYGSPMSAWMHHRQRGWYADGGLVEPLLRDSGGELPRGLSMILNNRPESEWIVNKPQIDRMAENFAARGQAGVTINGNVWAHSPEQVAQEIHKEARRKRAVALPV